MCVCFFLCPLGSPTVTFQLQLLHFFFFCDPHFNCVTCALQFLIANSSTVHTQTQTTHTHTNYSHTHTLMRALSFNMKVTECELIENTCNIYEERNMLPRHLSTDAAAAQHCCRTNKTTKWFYYNGFITQAKSKQTHAHTAMTVRGLRGSARAKRAEGNEPNRSEPNERLTDWESTGKGVRECEVGETEREHWMQFELRRERGSGRVH